MKKVFFLVIFLWSFQVLNSQEKQKIEDLERKIENIENYITQLQTVLQQYQVYSQNLELRIRLLEQGNTTNQVNTYQDGNIYTIEFKIKERSSMQLEGQPGIQKLKQDAADIGIRHFNLESFYEWKGIWVGYDAAGRGTIGMFYSQKEAIEKLEQLRRRDGVSYQIKIMDTK